MRVFSWKKSRCRFAQSLLLSLSHTHTWAHSVTIKQERRVKESLNCNWIQKRVTLPMPLLQVWSEETGRERREWITRRYAQFHSIFYEWMGQAASDPIGSARQLKDQDLLVLWKSHLGPDGKVAPQVSSKRDSDGRSALHIAASEGMKSIIHTKLTPYANSERCILPITVS